MNRKEFLLKLFAACVATTGTRSLPATEDILHILPPDNLDRLKLDFNASRNKVRLMFLLSPT